MLIALHCCGTHNYPDTEGFKERPQKLGLEFYRLGKSQTQGVIDIASVKRYRLKTLGLDGVLGKFERAKELLSLTRIEESLE